MFLPKQTTFLDTIIQQELQNFEEHIKESFVPDSIEDSFYQGNVVYKIPFKRTSVTTLLLNNTVTCVDDSKLREPVANKQGEDLLSRVSDKFINIAANAPFKECMNIIYNYQKRAGKHFYGALLRSTTNPDIILNPYHALAALSILDSEHYSMRETYNILLYFYTDRERADKDFKTKYASQEKIETNINALMQTYTTKMSSEVKIDKIERDVDNPIFVRVAYRETVHPDDDNSYMYHMTATQIMTKGIIAPYYGASLIRWDKSKTSCGGINLTPFTSCNLSSRPYITFENYESTSTNPVCTGRLSSTSITGLRTLSHSNHSSAYNNQNIIVGALAYADAMIEKIKQLYIKAGVIELTEDTEPVVCFTEEELSCMKFSDYVKLKTPEKQRTIPLSELKEQWSKIEQAKREIEDKQKQTELIEYDIVIDGKGINIGNTITFYHSTREKQFTGVLSEVKSFSICITNTQGEKGNYDISYIENLEVINNTQEDIPF